LLKILFYFYKGTRYKNKLLKLKTLIKEAKIQEISLVKRLYFLVHKIKEQFYESFESYSNFIISKTQKEKEAKKFYSGDSKNQTNKLSSLIKSLSLDALSSNFIIRKTKSKMENITSMFEKIGITNNVKRIKSDYILSSKDKNKIKIKKPCFQHIKWGLKLHNSLKSLNPLTKFKILQKRIIKLEQCILCDKNYKICFNNSECTDVFRLLRSLSQFYTRPTSILRHLYKIRSINIWLLKLQKAFFDSSIKVVRDLMSCVPLTVIN
jgi:hypothetical protein